MCTSFALTDSATAGTAVPGITLAVEPFIGHPVAVIVKAVTDLGNRHGFTVAGSPDTAGAGLNTGDTFTHGSTADSLHTIGALTSDAIVDDAVAVVVQIVTQFRRRQNLTRADTPRATYTGLCAVGAFSYVASTGTNVPGIALTPDAIISRAVAIVVQSITEFGRGPDSSGAH